MTMALVRFTPRARTHWHTHTLGQTLHVIEGVGLVGTRDGSFLRIHAGETVVCPPEKEHWHGATVDTFMAHMAIVEALPDGGDPTTWLEPLADEDYTPKGWPADRFVTRKPVRRTTIIVRRTGSARPSRWGQQRAVTAAPLPGSIESLDQPRKPVFRTLR
ncbi:hypothetical protein GCM10009682_28190 [Luedemannella flava]|uniref:Cupin type-2 domain-containing protein n=1 Tax=Luedemannella flava TaxID=349316 RepID=A0ABN2M1L0_9ACTN